MAEALAVFDLDGTLLEGDSHVRLLRDVALDPALPRAARAGLLANLAVGMGPWALGVRDNSWTKFVAARAFAGHTSEHLRGYLRRFVDSRVLPMVRPSMRARVERARSDGLRVLLLSASLDGVVERVAEALGADHAAGTRVEVAAGLVTGRLVGGAMHGPAKAGYLTRFASLRGYDLARSRSYGDSYADRHVLALVGDARVVNPGPRLRRVARARGWQIIAA